MKFRFLPLLAGAALCFGVGTLDSYAADYCTSGSRNVTDQGRADRKLTSLTISNGNDATTIAVNQSNQNGNPTYFDLTGAAVVAQPGATITFTGIDWTGGWMHSYAYVDYDNDGTFNTTLNANGAGTGEVVSYSFYSSNASASTSTDSRGASVGNGAGVSAANMPNFTLPSNLEAGDYRLRFKIDWNSLDPCGTTVVSDGGVIVDVTLRVEAAKERTITVKSADNNMGTVSIEGSSALSVTVAGEVTIKANPKNGYSFLRWINDATNEVYSEHSTVTILNNDDLSLTAEFVEFTYPTMFRTFTNSANQENRYLARVTTSGTQTPEVFNATTVEELPYTAFTAAAGTYVSAGAVIDKTANPIVIEKGTRSFTITYYGYNTQMGTYNPQINWTQEAYFVDWNRNGSFTDSGEISSKGNTAVPNTSINTANGMTRTVNVPADLDYGTYRMRVVFFEPQQESDSWPSKLFTTYNRQIRNGVAYDFDIVIPAQEFENERTITVATEDAERGTVAIINPATEESSVTTKQIDVQVAATPAEGYAFLNWTNAAGEVVSTSAAFAYSEEADVELTAHFGHSLNFTVTGTGSFSAVANGTNLPNGSVLVPGTEVTLTLTPAAGKCIALFNVNGESHTADLVNNEYTFTLDQNTNVIVDFADFTAHISWTVRGNGEIAAGYEADEDFTAPVDSFTSGDMISANRFHDYGMTFFVYPGKIEGSDDYESIETVTIQEGDDDPMDVTKEVEAGNDAGPEGDGTLADGAPFRYYALSQLPSADLMMVFVFTDGGESSAIENIFGDDDTDAPTLFYNLDGVRVNGNDLTPGIYVAKKGKKAAKVYVM